MEYWITCERNESEHMARVLLNGKFQEEALPELQRSLADAAESAASILLDLSEVTLVDRKTVQFLADTAHGGVKLVNCPTYLRKWIPQVSDEV